jgi:hypothetical protein
MAVSHALLWTYNRCRKGSTRRQGTETHKRSRIDVLDFTTENGCTELRSVFKECEHLSKRMYSKTAYRTSHSYELKYEEMATRWRKLGYPVPESLPVDYG